MPQRPGGEKPWELKVQGKEVPDRQPTHHLLRSSNNCGCFVYQTLGSRRLSSSPIAKKYTGRTTIDSRVAQGCARACQESEGTGLSY